MGIEFATGQDDLAALTDLINRVYLDAEKGLWTQGAERTTLAEVGALVRAGEIALMRDGTAVAGSVRIRQLSDHLGEFGMLVADPARRGAGIGRELVAFAEQWARDRGLRWMQLELLVPRTWEHPVKEFLRGWYTRIGYVPVRLGRFDEDFPELAPLLATPCDFLVMHKDLRTSPTGRGSLGGP
ncbi:GNAT family N-acetyltransferase [Paractinoplanes maris]|uniref:GNAT family N-acetyltransferase n=1 Tax=Paractinoplanes maris TaxID=1734446 RepID=UPI00201FCBAD|nr:GNAT family N-acetyltransferase [Actinoplanes maris]